MKFLVVFAFLLVAVAANRPSRSPAQTSTVSQITKEYEGICYNTADNACKNDAGLDALSAHCSAKYGGMIDEKQHLLKELQKFANLNIKRSFEYLLVSTHFANYEHNREGFANLFKGLSDETWNDGIEVIKHIAKRGGIHNFKESLPLDEKDTPNYEDYELQAMAKAVDVQKHLAEKALNIHREASKHHKDHGHNLMDAEIAHYIEEKFAEKQAESVRTLVGHVTDLRKLLLEGKDGSLALHMFDEYIKK